MRGVIFWGYIYPHIAFIILSHPGAYPATASNNPRIQAKEEVEHEVKNKEYKKSVGVIDRLKVITQQKVEKVWIEELDNEIMGCFNVTV